MSSQPLRVIIGHRGTGKSSFLARMAGSWPVDFYDLDLEIEKSQGVNVWNIFRTQGEAAFRKIEAQVFKKLSQKPAVIAVGAGFDLNEIPAAAEVIWLRRDSDQRGRIFTDRPRLLSETDPLSEFETKRKEREPAFLKRADFIYTVPEGLQLSELAQQSEKKLFTEGSIKALGFKTLFPADLKRQSLADPAVFELRDDLLSNEQMQIFLQKKSSNPASYVYSLRSEAPPRPQIIEHCLWLDQPVEGSSTGAKSKKIILSCHHEDILQSIKLLSENQAQHLKLSPLVLNWKDLWVGHQWQQQDPDNRSFLPRSLEGRWKWYRLFQKGRQKINFWYESESSALDQPSLLEWLMQPEKVSSFGAVLGSPVHHSLSPMAHFDFFKARQASFFAIDIKDSEASAAWPMLQALGLRAAAVTSPLKKWAYEISAQRTELAEELQSVNTLEWSDISKKWQGANTDFPGFLQSLEGKALPSSFVIWGGEGVLSILKKALPEASAYSARTGKPKSGNREVSSPSTLIWAAASRGGVQWPPGNWDPTVVVDLNYAENSWGRQYALQSKARYESGLEFFRFQALEQQKFWS